MKKDPKIIVGALLFTIAILSVGYFAFGLITDLIFASGFLTGFIIWVCVKSEPSFDRIKIPYWGTLVLFILHRVEEKVMDFFDKLAEITKVPTPDIASFEVITLVIVSFGAWLAIPYLVKRRHAVGYYLSWTFFSAMGITELAHFIFPFFTNEPYGYFPGMASVVLLAPIAWWGMYRLRTPESMKPESTIQ
jgi:Protein of unknown function with HXXEE motif